jgi:hypothetical protein
LIEDKIEMKTFEDLPVYQKAKELCISIYKFENDKYKKDYGFKDQIQRASVSVLNNIAEEFERATIKTLLSSILLKRFCWRNKKFAEHSC